MNHPSRPSALPRAFVRPLLHGALAIGAWAAIGARSEAPPAPPQPIPLMENGGWCWFQGERALVVSNRLFFTTIAGTTTARWQAGDLVATQVDLATGERRHAELHDRLETDDHDVAALLVRQDGRLLAVYGRHGTDSLQRWRISTRPLDATDWEPEGTLDIGAGYTYANAYALAAENGRILNFHRGRGFNPNVTVSDDGGRSWRYAGRAVSWTRDDLKGDPRHTGLDGTRPYVRYASDGQSRIHLLMTDDHPRAYDNSLYHGYYEKGAFHASDGRSLGRLDDGSTRKPRDFTTVFAGAADRVAWAVDLRLDGSGHPWALFSVQRDGAATRTRRGGEGGQDHRYHLAGWNGTSWTQEEIAFAGTRLYAGEDDYTGLGALDPADPTRLWISTNADPQTGAPLISQADQRRHWEIFEGRRVDGRWTWRALTRDSTVDNLRPLRPAGSGGAGVLLWTRGRLESFTRYSLEVVMIRLEDAPSRPGS